jgi:hypothetical protein
VRHARELDHFALHHVGQAVDAHDAVGDRGHGAFVARFGGELDLLDAVLISSLISDGLSCVVAILVFLVSGAKPALRKKKGVERGSSVR